MANMRNVVFSWSAGGDENDEGTNPVPLANRLTRDNGNPVIVIEDDDEEETNKMVLSNTGNVSSNNQLSKKVKMFGIEMVRVDEGDETYEFVKKKFLGGFPEIEGHVNIELIVKNTFSSFAGQAQLQTFNFYSDVITRARRNANSVKFAWYGTSKEGVSRILSHGFTKHDTCDENGHKHGVGIHLCHVDIILNSLRSTTIDERGLRHLILCRVIVGNMEEIARGSEQFHPSSQEYDSGCDNLFIPCLYIIWTNSMNTHIVPEYVVSFRAPVSLQVKGPTCSSVGVDELMTEMSDYLNPEDMLFLQKYFRHYSENKITEQHMCQVIQQTTGGDIIIEIFKRCLEKKKRAGGIPPNI